MKGIAFFISPIFAIFGFSSLSSRVVPSKASRNKSMYFSCHAGYFAAAKIVSFFGFLGSNAMFFPLSFFFCCAASAEVILEDVERTYSRAAESAGDGAGTEGKSSFWIVEG